jgi:hypothetical protein
MQKWHEAGNTGCRDKEKTTLNQEPGRDKKTEKDCGEVQNVTVA